MLFKIRLEKHSGLLIIFNKHWLSCCVALKLPITAGACRRCGIRCLSSQAVVQVKKQLVSENEKLGKVTVNPW